MCKPHWLTHQQPNIEFDMLKACLTLVTSHTSMNMSDVPAHLLHFEKTKQKNRDYSENSQVRIGSETTGNCMSEWDTHTQWNKNDQWCLWHYCTSLVWVFFTQIWSIILTTHTYTHTQWCSRRVSSRSQVFLCTQTSWKKWFFLIQMAVLMKYFFSVVHTTRTTSEVWELLPWLQ